MTDTKNIRIRILAFQEDNNFYIVSLDTNIIVKAKDLELAKTKMIDALISYFNTFEEKEILEGKHIRKASINYLIRWHLNPLVAKAFKMINNASSLEYNPHSKDFQLA